MNKSEQINELATALARAQGKITGALKDSKNPFYDSNYADLASCWDAVRTALSENGLSVIQGTKKGDAITINWKTTAKSGAETEFTATTNEIIIVTELLHSTGQFVSSELAMVPGDATPQGIGKCITYGRRYGLSAMLGIAQIDDDGNSASMKGDDSGRPAGWKAQDTRKVTEYKKRIMDLVADGADLSAVDVWLEIKGDHDFATAVFQQLPATIKQMIKANMPKVQE